MLVYGVSRSLLRTYAHDDVSVGSWFIGLDVKHINEGKFCCSSWSSGLGLSLLSLDFIFNVNIRVIKEIWVSNIHIKVTENIMWVSGAICAGV